MMEMDAYTFNKVYPISQVQIFQSGWRVIRESLIQYKPRTPDRAKRGKVKKRSKKSLSRLAFTVMNTTVLFTSLLTLTYPSLYPLNGAEVKSQLREFLQKMKRRYAPLDYLWFLEFQIRNAPHIHMLTTVGEVGAGHRDWFSGTWADICVGKEGGGDSQERDNHLYEWSKVKYVHNRRKGWEDIRKENGARRYALKYAMKPEQVIVPDAYSNVGRFWGHNANVRPVALMTVDTCEEDFKDWLISLGNPCGDYEIIPELVLDRRSREGS